MRILEFLSDTLSFELGVLETISYFVICISKTVSIFTESALKTKNLGRGKNILYGKH